MRPPPRTLRADAARNRELLLAAAEIEFAEKGINASVADITRRAGVAKGTFFHHFTTKDDLIAAIVGHHVAELTDAGESLLGSADPGAALLEILTLAAGQRQQHDVSFLLRANDADTRVAEARDRLYATIGALVDRARASGAVRPDVEAVDVILLICAPNHVAEQARHAPPDLWRRYLAIIFDGLRPEAAHPLPQPPPAI